MSSHCERSPKSVEARNQRYFPLASHPGQTASASPSVTCFVSPVSTLLTKTAWYSERKRLEYATHFESGLQTGFNVRAGTIHGSSPTIFACSVARSRTQTFKFVSVKSSFLESGDHDGV